MYPNEYLKKLWLGISNPIKITFASSFVIGLIVHMYKITNMLHNHDSVVLFDDGHWIVVQGRWFAFVPKILSSGYLLPWVIGLLAILYIAISSCIVVKCFRIINSLHCVLVSGLMVSFPTITIALTYSSEVLISALLLACLAVYFTIRFRFGFIAGIIFIAMSLGVYQAYFSVAAGLSVGILIIDIIHDKLSLKEIIIKGVKFFSILLFGVIVYFVMVNISINVTHFELSTYQGINEMGRIPISEIPRLVKMTYISIFQYYIRDNYGLHSKLMQYAFCAVVIITIIFFLTSIIQKKIIAKKFHLILLLVLVILYPLACNVVYLMNPVFVYLNLIYGMVLLPVAVIVMMELVQSNVNQKEMKYFKLFKQGACWLLTAVFIVCIYQYGILANKVYNKMHVVYEQGYAYSVELLTHIHGTEGYIDTIPVLFYGSPGAILSLNHDSVFDDISKITGAANNIPASYSYNTFLHNFIGSNLDMQVINADQVEQYGIAQALETMSIYPEPGSIKRVNDVMLVKFVPFVDIEILSK
jgi:hypothetical protein